MQHLHDDLGLNDAILHLFMGQNDCPVEVQLIFCGNAFPKNGIVLDTSPASNFAVPAHNRRVDVRIVLHLQC